MSDMRLTANDIRLKREPWFIFSLFAAILLFSLSINAAPRVVGKISFLSGEVTAKQPLGQLRLLRVKDAVLLGDVVATSDESYVVILFVDSAGVTLRPNTALHVKRYVNTPGDKSALLRIIRGGVRTATGEIAKKYPGKFVITTPRSTVKVKNKYSDFSVRACESDCNEENKKMFPPKMRTSLPVIAKVVVLKGTVVVGRRYKRKLEVGHSVYSTEHLVSDEDSYAHLQFRDGSSVSLQASSAFDITDYKYDGPGLKNSSVFKLIAGGLRFVTGLIAKKDRASFSLKTRVATIGVRGTDFSANCFGGCDTGGIVTHVTKGSITQTNRGGTFSLEAGSYSAISGPKSTPVVTRAVPFFENNIAPDPSLIKIDTQSLFAESGSIVEHGTYVAVINGSIEVTGRRDSVAIIGTNQSGYVNESGIATNIGGIKNFQSLDPISISPIPLSLVGAYMPTIMPDFSDSINTIVIGDPDSASSTTMESAAGSTSITTTVIQEQTIATPY